MHSGAVRKIGVFGLVGLVGLAVWKFSGTTNPTPGPAAVVVERPEVIPPSIIVTESSAVVPMPQEQDLALGDPQLAGFGDPALAPKNDLFLLAQSLSNFLLLAKQATDRPLSANEEWSAALRGKRPGSGAWFSEKSPVWDAQLRLVDRWQTPLFFHSLGDKQWEIRSAGPDLHLWTADDLTQKTITRGKLE
jgi:hypothetical protein